MMEAIAKLLLAVIVCFGVPSLVVLSGWHLVGIVPEVVRGAIVTLIPYGIALMIWVVLVWICLQFFAEVMD